MEKETVSGGVAKMAGQVDSFAERDILDRVVRDVSGVRVVRNEVAIRYDRERPDEEVSADVQSRLRWDGYPWASMIGTGVKDPRVSSAQVRATSQDGVAKLHGTVENLEAKQAAGQGCAG